MQSDIWRREVEERDVDALSGHRLDEPRRIGRAAASLGSRQAGQVTVTVRHDDWTMRVAVRLR